MNLSSKVFLRKKFKEYYFRNRIPSPPEVARREFGVGTLEDKIKFRHKSFQSARELEAYLRAEAPFYISYSSAYYEFPANTPMESKNWLGADLVFDLDVPMSFADERKMEEVKGEALNLLDFLTNDFAFPRARIEVNFSGSKGYHIHVYDESVRKLSGDARREIVDYVTGTGLDIDYFMEDTPVPGDRTVDSPSKGKRDVLHKGPSGAEGGWGGKIYQGVCDFFRNATVDDFQSLPGVGEKKASELMEFASEHMRDLERREWSLLKKFGDKTWRKILANIIEAKAVKMAGDTDKMVTIDTSRPMRLPGTLHGGTGFSAAIVKDLDSFNPLSDAVVFGSGMVDVTLSADVPKIKLKGESLGPFKTGEKTPLPEYAAVYLILKGAAEMSK